MIALAEKPKTATRKTSVTLMLLWLYKRQVLVPSLWLSGIIIIADCIEHSCNVYPATVMIGVLTVYFIMIMPFAYALSSTSPIGDGTSHYSAYPSHLFIRPVTTRALVTWPMIFGAVIMAAVGLLVDLTKIMPVEWGLPWYAPPLFLITVTAWTQAMAWTPISIRFRVASLILVWTFAALMFWLFGVVIENPTGTPQFIGVIILCLLVLPAYPIAMAGVATARCGDWSTSPDPDWSTVGQQPRSTTNAISAEKSETSGRLSILIRSFASKHDAQSWLDWNCIVANGISGTISILYTGLMIAPALIGLPGSGHFNNQSINISLVHNCNVEICPTIGLLSGFFGIIWGISETQRKAALSVKKFSAFSFCRPVSSFTVASARLALKNRVAMVAIPSGLLMLTTQCSIGRLSGHIGILMFSHPGYETLCIAILLVVGFVYTFWRIQVDGAYLSYVTGVAQIAARLGLTAGTILLLRFAYQTLCDYGILELCTVAAITALIKVTGLVAVVWASSKKALVTTAVINRLTFYWIAAAIGLSATLLSMFPFSTYPWWGVVALAILAMPGVRVAILPLAIDHYRHG